MSLTDLFEGQEADPELIPVVHNTEVRLHTAGTAAAYLALFNRVVGILPAHATGVGSPFASFHVERATHEAKAYAEVGATDGERHVTSISDKVSVYVSGQTLLPAQRLVQILRRVPQPEVELEVHGQVMLVKSGRALWTVALPSGDTLPIAPPRKVARSRVPRSGLLVALQAASRALGAPGGRPSLAQAHVAQGRITTCDGARLHRIDIPEFSLKNEFSIPSAAVGEMIKTLNDSREDTVLLGADDRFVVLQVGETTITVQQLTVHFPDTVARLFDAAALNTYSLVVNTSALRFAVERVRVNADPDWAQMTLTVLPSTLRKGHQLIVHARDRNGNGAQEVLECQWTGPDKSADFTFNKAHLTDLLTSWSDDRMVLHLLDTRSSLYAEDPETGLTVVIQQMVAR